MAATEPQGLPQPPKATNSWQSAVQLNPPPPPLKKPSRLGKILVDNVEKVNRMHEDQRRRRLSVLDTSECESNFMTTAPGRFEMSRVSARAANCPQRRPGATRS